MQQAATQAPLHISRNFTTAGCDPLDEITYELRDAVIRDSDGSVVFELRGVEAPAEWSQLATDIAVSKYFRKAGVPVTGHETSVRQMVSRVALAVSEAALRQGYVTVNGASVLRDELAFLLITQRAAFNSPVWFNCGHSEAYGIKGDGAGSWRWSESSKDIVPALDTYANPQVSACFIQSIKDDLMDITAHVQREARIFKHGSGAGANFSALRAKGEPLSNGGTSSGMMSFLEVFDRAAGAIKSGGTTRRAAKMVSLDVDHPDIEEFISWKSREEEKAKALIRAGYSSDFNGEAYRTVSGQNANNSVRVTDDFMKKAMSGEDYATRWRTTGKEFKKSASDILRKIATAAWECADPGLQYDTAINDWHTCADTSRINGSNPCSEYMFIDNSACNLASINLVEFMAEDGAFNHAEFSDACRVIFIAQEVLVDHASYPTEEIARNSRDYRPLGLGYANIGALLMRRGIPYDSAEGRGIAGAITSLMTAVAYEASADMAKVKGPFPSYGDNKNSMQRVMAKHALAHRQIEAIGKKDMDTYEAGLSAWTSALVKGEEHGYRNAQATLLAPTGTIGLLMDCDTTGIEPDFALVKYKKLAGGGAFKIVNQSVPRGLRALGYDAATVQGALLHLKEHDTVEGAPGLRDGDLPVFDCANRCGKTGRRVIDPMGHINMMAAVQPFLSGAISKTVNLPNETTVEEIESVYVKGWELGLKAVALYRDGSKGCQVLTSSEDDATAPVPAPPRKRLRKKRRGSTFELRVGGQKVYLRTGEYEDGAVGEVFVDMHKEGATMRSMTNSFAIAVSLGLQHGVPLEEYVDAFTFANFTPNGPVQGHDNIKHASSVIDLIMRVLAFEYLDRHDLVQIKPDGTTAADNHDSGKAVMVADSQTCDTCGSLTRRNGTCYVCDNCGSQTGCG